MTMEEVELGYLLQDNVVCNLARVLPPLWNIQLFQKCATYMYDNSIMFILTAKLFLFLDGLI